MVALWTGSVPSEVMALNEDEIAFFRRYGYLVLPGWYDPAFRDRIAAAVDRYAEGEPAFDGRNVPSYPELVDLVTHPGILAIADQLMGGSQYALHHCHAARHRAGLKGVGWHHDYEQIPQTNRSHLQLHVLSYLNGLNGTIGDLLVWPKSHRAVMRRDAFWFFGPDDLPGSVVIDDLPEGSVVLAHSALVHARRPQPGGEGESRYFLDVAYCQAGVRWPSYGREGWDEMLLRFAEVAPSVAAARPGLFDPRAFVDTAELMARLDGLAGSIAEHLPEATAARPHSGSIPLVG